MKTELEKIIYMEHHFPEIFSDMEKRDFGILFYNKNNFDSNDSNHAIITKKCDYEAVLQEIKDFYLSKSLEPLIYSSLEENQLNEMSEYLTNSGFHINDYGYKDYLVWSGKTSIVEPYSLTFERFTKNSDFDVFSELVESASLFRISEVIRRRVNDPNYYLFIGYDGEIPVVMASFQLDKNLTAMLDEVETAENQRGKGYARQITRHITNEFEKQGGKLFYTWAANETAQRVYLQGGFEVKYKLHSWSAYIERELK